LVSTEILLVSKTVRQKQTATTAMCMQAILSALHKKNYPSLTHYIQQTTVKVRCLQPT